MFVSCWARRALLMIVFMRVRRGCMHGMNSAPWREGQDV